MRPYGRGGFETGKKRGGTFIIDALGEWKMKALIFGIGGFVGWYLAQELLDSGYEVYGSDIQADNMQPEVKFYKADLLEQEAVQEVVAKVVPDMIINLAAVSSVGLSWKFPQKTMSVNVVGTLNIMEAVRNCKTNPKVLFIGSSEEYRSTDQPIDENILLKANNPYGISKMAQEKFVEIYRQQYHMQIYYVRPFNHTGIGQKDSFVLPSFCRQAAEIEKSGKPGIIRVGNLAAERDFSDVRDIVRAYRMIIESGNCGKVYNVGSGKAYSLETILEYIISLSAQEITVKVDPERFRPIDTKRICCDHHRIERELGWKPEYSIFDTLKEMFEYYKTI